MAHEITAQQLPAQDATLSARLRGWFDPTKRRAVAALVIRVAGAGLAYVMQMLLAQWMGLEAYGVFVGIWVWLLVLGGVAPLGLQVGIIGQLATLRDAGDHAAWCGLMLTSLAVGAGVGVVVAAAGWVLILLAPGLIASPYAMPLALALVCVPLIAVTEVNEGIARANNWMITALAPTYILRPVLIIAGAYFAPHEPLDATVVFAIAIMACLVAIFVQTAVLVFRVLRTMGWGGVAGRPTVWIVAALPIILTQTFELLTQNFDMMAVSYFLGPEATGVYFAALKTIGLLAFINFAVGAATASRVASLHAARDAVEMAKCLRMATNLAFWPTVGGAVVLVAVAPRLLGLFGSDFAAYADLTVILAVGFVAKAFVGPAELYLNVIGQQRSCAVVLLIAAAVNVGLNILLIPLIGLEGAAVATSVSLVVLSWALHRIVRQSLEISLHPTIGWSTAAAR